MRNDTVQGMTPGTRVRAGAQGRNSKGLSIRTTPFPPCLISTQRFVATGGCGVAHWRVDVLQADATVLLYCCWSYVVYGCPCVFSDEYFVPCMLYGNLCVHFLGAPVYIISALVPRRMPICQCVHWRCSCVHRRLSLSTLSVAALVAVSLL